MDGLIEIDGVVVAVPGPWLADLLTPRSEERKFAEAA